MKKIYCDECGDEITDNERVRRSIVLRIDHYGKSNKGEFLCQDLCGECTKKARAERKWVSI